MLKKRTTTALLALLVAGAAVASPDSDDGYEYYERRGPMPFEAFDRDDDDRVTRQEQRLTHDERQRYRAMQGRPVRDVDLDARFDAIDTDGDGVVSRDELAAWQAMHRQQRMSGGLRR